MGYICCLGGFIEPSKNLGGKYEPSKMFRGQKQTLFYRLWFAMIASWATSCELHCNSRSTTIVAPYLYKRRSMASEETIDQNNPESSSNRRAES
jgi:hypothetical protein